MKEFDRLMGGDGAAWVQAMGSFMEKADIAFGMLGTELWSRDGLALLFKALRKFGKKGSLEFGGELLSSCRHWLTQTFSSPRIHGLLAPWVFHTGLGPDSAGSGFMTQVISATLQLGGMPIPRGGGARLVDALVGIIQDYGGQVETESDVRRILVKDGKANGVRLHNGSTITAGHAVICCVTPTQLYLRLLDGTVAPEWVFERARKFRYGRADMQIHLALSEPPQWPGGDERFLRTAVVHVTLGLNGVSKAVNEAERGTLTLRGHHSSWPTNGRGPFPRPVGRLDHMDSAPRAAQPSTGGRGGRTGDGERNMDRVSAREVCGPNRVSARSADP